jgi:hypothetical protein
MITVMKRRMRNSLNYVDDNTLAEEEGRSSSSSDSGASASVGCGVSLGGGLSNAAVVEGKKKNKEVENCHFGSVKHDTLNLFY